MFCHFLLKNIQKLPPKIKKGDMKPHYFNFKRAAKTWKFKPQKGS